MRGCDVEIGMRVVVVNEFAGLNDLRNKEGTVIGFDSDDHDDYLAVCVEFDEEFEDGHNCGGRGIYGRCRYGPAHQLEPVLEAVTYEITFSYDELMGGSVIL